MPLKSCKLLSINKIYAYSALLILAVATSICLTFVLSDSMSPRNQIGMTIASFIVLVLLVNLIDYKFGYRFSTRKIDVEYETSKLKESKFVEEPLHECTEKR